MSSTVQEQQERSSEAYQELLDKYQKLEEKHQAIIDYLTRTVKVMARQQRLLRQMESNGFSEASGPAAKQRKGGRRMTGFNGELMLRLCNPNFSFRVHEDIYNRFQFPWATVPAGARIVLYGGGIVGKIFLEQLQRASYCTVVAVCDRAPEKTGIVEAPLITIKELAGMPSSSYDMILIAIEKKSIAKEIREALVMAGREPGRSKWVDPARKK